MTQSTSREAACACGQLSLTVTGEPAMISQCHCLLCQRRTGSPYGVTAFFRRDQAHKPVGTSQPFHRKGDSGNGITFHFCPRCGSTVFWEPDARPEMLCISVGTFADPEFGAPQRSIWAESRHAWVEAVDAPTFPKAPT